jgi:hypothetical protein
MSDSCKQEADGGHALWWRRPLAAYRLLLTAIRRQNGGATADPSPEDRPNYGPNFLLLTVHGPFIIVAVLPGLDGPHYVPRPLHCG